MTPEERARIVFNEIEEIEGSSASPAIIGLIEDAIAAAIREARNEALEEAAKAVLAHNYNPSHSDFAAGAHIAVQHIANRILTLKDTTPSE
jgi:hypothetical protein